MIYTYDEHGGFFDHRAPLPVQQKAPAGQYTAFQTTGPRVPTVVVSPMVDNKVRHEWFDQTSILQLLAERFGDPAAPITASVAARRQPGIRSVSAVLDASLSRTGLPDLPVIPKPSQAMEPTFQPMPIPLQESIGKAAQALAASVGWAEDVLPEIPRWIRQKTR